uniref:START domain-containing protein n=1 Tax=Zooxanthella nutricula TaxID=1333877 RepID=A0A6U6X1E8_9DINO|mmetsp:Transcript_95872/g.293240  ORF Transcript_95872/g.293240 Transcript_95872/m.293240 type:complete len:234 (+) Transcript_95872:137-838(+)|eukprot:CAMPEP_0198498510 /NCGR_PEP_ID=MMETSP1462-20131121/7054_1 /TAXON_ID=1333877 /ORGANISM="Brandtodinium nutriculum, Strain RCC3387" /LENGTH=233 /DNA_ID=CAMNT_0044227433 /DNA_START=119 /DNA_END=820 /DNA_ORIENTATION=+
MEATLLDQPLFEASEAGMERFVKQAEDLLASQLSDWSVYREGDGIKMWTRPVPYAGTPLARLEVHVKAPVEQSWAVLRNSEEMKRWDPSDLGITILKQVSPAPVDNALMFQLNQLPIPCTSVREVLQQRIVLDDKKLLTACSVTSPEYPPTAGRVRYPQRMLCMRVRASAPGEASTSESSPALAAASVVDILIQVEQEGWCCLGALLNLASTPSFFSVMAPGIRRICEEGPSK